ncbi:MAG TPA: fumarylacetoacetase [Chitinophagales bacterium]|nr:fumarylacetoacetase [Chitinophagales bacterium]
MSRANDPGLQSWISVPEESDFPIQNLPFGIFQTDGLSPRVGVAIGDQVLDLAALNRDGFLTAFDLPDSILENQYLNDFIKLGKDKTSAVREHLSDLLQEENAVLRDAPDAVNKYFHLQASVQMLLPVQPGDYTDFYSSEVHATNIGRMFRPDNPLMPNWKYIPVGYHGRSSTIIVSGEHFHRPKGQILEKDGEPPVFRASTQLDFELETAFITFDGPAMGQSITTSEAEQYIFGMVLFNDWSARDIQRWEYVPLGPFLAKNFASSISPWVVTLDALQPFYCEGPVQDPPVLDYLRFNGPKNIDISLEVGIIPEGNEETTVCHSNFKYMYWNINQQLAHQTVNGCLVRAGDMYGSGTISAPAEDGYGSMMELTWRGQNPLIMKDGSTRKFIEDGDTVVIRGWCERNGIRVGFGEVSSKVLPAI